MSYFIFASYFKFQYILFWGKCFIHNHILPKNMHNIIIHDPFMIKKMISISHITNTNSNYRLRGRLAHLCTLNFKLSLIFLQYFQKSQKCLFISQIMEDYFRNETQTAIFQMYTHM